MSILKAAFFDNVFLCFHMRTWLEIVFATQRKLLQVDTKLHPVYTLQSKIMSNQNEKYQISHLKGSYERSICLIRM